MYPVQSNDISVIIIQQCIRMLNKNGLCAIVLPDG